MKEEFTKKLHLNKANKLQLEIINKIIDEYAKQGYTLTLRQLYYQLVSRDIIPNQQKEYAKLSGLLVKGRMAGIVDWDAIEDRIRRPYIPYWVKDVEHAIKDTISQYRLDRQQGQKTYIELWVEKDALSGVLKRITGHYHIYLMVNRGYSSCSAMHDSYERIKTALEQDRKIVILYLGDHDPSGLDMVRDIKARLKEFLINSDFLKDRWEDLDPEEHDNLIPELEENYYYDEDGKEVVADFDGEEFADYAKMYANKLFDELFEVRHIGLTDAQIRLYNPPPNPAKFSDPRAKWYVEKYGKTSWEVDALNPDVLHQIVQTNVEGMIDIDLFNKQVEKEKVDKKKLQSFASKVKEDK